MGFIRRFFKLRESGTTVRTEMVAGLTTFMTLSYIIFVQPAILSAAGMDAGAVMCATCVASAVACIAMGLTANYPIALAPGMGHNVYFAFVVCVGMGYTWQQALAATFIAGALFLLLCAVPFREKILEMIPDSLRQAIGAGIGLLIALVGLEYAGIVVGKAPTYLSVGSMKEPATLLALAGLAVTVVLIAMRFRGAILVGIVFSTVVGMAAHIIQWRGPAESLSMTPTLFKFTQGFADLFRHPGTAASIIFVMLFLVLFDTVGTLAGVGARAGFLKDGKLPRAKWAFFSDALGTVTGAVCGTSTITAYVESGAGIQAGGRTGLANMVTAALFLASLAAFPVVQLVAASVPLHYTYAGHACTAYLYPVIAPALIVVGAMMMQNVTRINWEDPTEYLPAFLAIMIMPCAFSITDGIAFGFISCSLLKLVTGRGREVHWLFHVFSGLFVVRYVFF